MTIQKQIKLFWNDKMLAEMNHALHPNLPPGKEGMTKQLCALNRHDYGFTLLEIIIALFIFSIVSIIIVSALHNVLNTQAATEKKAARLAELQIALLLLSRDIEQTVNRPIVNASGMLEGFIGSSHTITFTHAGFVNPFGQLQRSTLQR